MLQLWKCCTALTDCCTWCTFLPVTVSLKVWQRETHVWLMWQQTHVGLWPCMNPDTCGLLSLHLSLRLRRSASNWLTSEPADGTSSELLQSMSMGPVASLHPASTSAPPEVCVVIYICMCVWPCFVCKSCLTPTALHLLRLGPWNRWPVRLLRPDVTSYLTIQTQYMWWIFYSQIHFYHFWLMAFTLLCVCLNQYLGINMWKSLFNIKYFPLTIFIHLINELKWNG